MRESPAGEPHVPEHHVARADVAGGRGARRPAARVRRRSQRRGRWDWIERLFIIRVPCKKNDCKALDDVNDCTEIPNMLTSPAGPAAGADEPGGDDAADPAAAPTVAAAAAARTEDRRALGEQGRKAAFTQSSMYN